MPEKEKLRIDKYLWAVRAFKTRTLASDACKAGRVKLDSNNIKPSHEVKIGEVYQVSKGPDRKIIKVTGLLESRTDAKTAVGYYEDITPVEQTPAFRPTRNELEPNTGSYRTPIWPAINFKAKVEIHQFQPNTDSHQIGGNGRAHQFNLQSKF